MMKILIRFLLALSLLPVCVSAVERDRIAAIVNKDIITVSELKARIVQAEQSMARQGTPKPAPAQLRAQVLERMILERLQIEKAKEFAISIDDQALDRALQRIAEENKITLADLPKAVEKEGLSWKSFRENIRSEIMMARLREREVDSRITVSPAEVEAQLALNAQTKQPREYLISHILLRAPEGATPDQWMSLGKRADDLMRQIQQGEDFAKLAAAYSNAQDAMQGGLIDWRPLERVPTLFAEVVPDMKKGDVSKVLRSAAGLHVFKLLDVRDVPAKRVEIEQTHARHILIRTNEVSNAAQATRRLNEIAERIRNGADFGDLAKANSSDITSTKGGDLGWLSPGETVPEFDRAMNALKPGEISAPVESPFGFHLIQVLERRKVDVTEDRRKLEAQQALRGRKVDEAFEDWLRQLRDSAYVEIKAD